MTPKQQRFVEEYLVDLNATQAAIRAGYSAATAEVSGCRLLRNVQIRQAVDEALRQRSRETGITAEWVIGQLQENVTLAKAAGDIGPANKALELLGKHLGLFVERQQIEGNLSITLGTWRDA